MIRNVIKWDGVISARGINLGYSVDPIADPEITEKRQSELTVIIQCVEPSNNQEYLIDVEFTFINVRSWQIAYSELPTYNLDDSDYHNQPFLYEVNYQRIDRNYMSDRPRSYYPLIEERYDLINWFDALDNWDPTIDKLPALPIGLKHFILVGHDKYIEIISTGYDLRKIDT